MQKIKSIINFWRFLDVLHKKVSVLYCFFSALTPSLRTGITSIIPNMRGKVFRIAQLLKLSLKTLTGQISFDHKITYFVSTTSFANFNFLKGPFTPLPSNSFRRKRFLLATTLLKRLV